MSLSKKTLQQVIDLAGEVEALARQADTERRNVRTSRYVDGAWEESTEERTVHPGYTKTSAALKRRSMDLTRALADLRRAG